MIFDKFISKGTNLLDKKFHLNLTFLHVIEELNVIENPQIYFNIIKHFLSLDRELILDYSKAYVYDKTTITELNNSVLKNTKEYELLFTNYIFSTKHKNEEKLAYLIEVLNASIFKEDFDNYNNLLNKVLNNSIDNHIVNKSKKPLKDTGSFVHYCSNILNFLNKALLKDNEKNIPINKEQYTYICNIIFDKKVFDEKKIQKLSTLLYNKKSVYFSNYNEFINNILNITSDKIEKKEEKNKILKSSKNLKREFEEFNDINQISSNSNEKIETIKKKIKKD
jgi:hypothetical protein